MRDLYFFSRTMFFISQTQTLTHKHSQNKNEANLQVARNFFLQVVDAHFGFFFLIFCLFQLWTIIWREGERRRRCEQVNGKSPTELRVKLLLSFFAFILLPLVLILKWLCEWESRRRRRSRSRHTHTHTSLSLACFLAEATPPPRLPSSLPLASTVDSSRWGLLLLPHPPLPHWLHLPPLMILYTLTLTLIIIIIIIEWAQNGMPFLIHWLLLLSLSWETMMIKWAPSRPH